MLFGPLDPLLVVLYTARKVRWLRPFLLTFGLIPAVLWALPPVSCGCLPTFFRRCDGFSGRERAYMAAMKSDLKNFASQQEIYYSDRFAYSPLFERIGFVSSDGVELTVFVGDGGWAARTTHVALEDADACAMYYGEPPEHGFEELAEAEPGEVVCTR